MPRQSMVSPPHLHGYRPEGVPEAMGSLQPVPPLHHAVDHAAAMHHCIGNPNSGIMKIAAATSEVFPSVKVST